MTQAFADKYSLSYLNSKESDFSNSMWSICLPCEIKILTDSNNRKEIQYDFDYQYSDGNISHDVQLFNGYIREQAKLFARQQKEGNNGDFSDEP